MGPVIDNYIQETSQKGVSAEELKERIAFIKKTRDEFRKIQESKGIPMPYTE